MEKNFESYQDAHIAIFTEDGIANTVIVKAKVFEIEGFEELFMVHPSHLPSQKNYIVSELSTGMQVGISELVKINFIEEEAISAATQKMNTHKHRWESIMLKAIKILAKSGLSYPVNRIEAKNIIS